MADEIEEEETKVVAEGMADEGDRIPTLIE
jgi:hypothetical protein